MKTFQYPITDADADTDSFTEIITPAGAFTIDAKVSDITTGSPTWTLLVSNTGGDEADYKDYAPETTDMAITDAIQSDKLNFKYIAIKYTSNSSTGLISFVIGAE